MNYDDLAGLQMLTQCRNNAQIAMEQADMKSSNSLLVKYIEDLQKFLETIRLIK